MMNKTWINFLVDLSMFVSIMLVSMIGLIMKYILPPGSGGGRHGGEGGEFAETFFWLTRHEWGGLHSQIAVVLLSLLAVHLLLHWTWIKGRFQAPLQKNKARTALKPENDKCIDPV